MNYRFIGGPLHGTTRHVVEPAAITMYVYGGRSGLVRYYLRAVAVQTPTVLYAEKVMVREGITELRARELLLQLRTSPLRVADLVPQIRWLPIIASSCIAQLGYDHRKEVLDIEFVETGNVYRYFDVPASEVIRLICAASLGSHFNTEIRGQYRSERYL